MDGHLDPCEIAGFIDGSLDEDELERAWEHLDRCAECVRWVADTVRASYDWDTLWIL